MKRWICAILIALMLIPPMAVSAEGEPAWRLTAEEGSVGETVRVTLSVEDFPECASCELFIDYDKTYLKPKAYGKGESVNGMVVANLEYSVIESDHLKEPGYQLIKMACVSLNGKACFSGDMDLITIDFEILKTLPMEGAKVELLKYTISRNNEELTKIKDLPLLSAQIFDPTVPQVEALSVNINKTSYYEGQSLDLENATLWIAFSNNTTTEIPLTMDMISGYDPYEIGRYTVTVSYGGMKAYFDVDILEEYPQDLDVTKPINKTEYFVGEELELRGGEVTLTYNSGRTETVSMAECTLENYDKDQEGWQIIGLCYKDCFTSFSVLYKAIALESIAVTTMPQTAYIEGQPLQLAGGVLTLTYNNGDTEELALTAVGVTVSGYEKNEIGTQPLTVTYGGKETTFEVAVRAKMLTGISIRTAPKSTYIENQELDLSAGVLLLTFDNGDIEELALTAAGVTVSGYEKNEIGTQPLTVTYGGKETTFEVAVRAKMLTGISIQTAPLQNTYYVGETPSAAGGMLLLTYDNDTTELLPMVADGVLIDECDVETDGEKVINVSYGGFDTIWEVTYLPLKTIASLSFTLDGYALGNQTTDLQLTMEGEGVCEHTIYGEHYALFDVNGFFAGEIKGGVNYTFGILLTAKDHYTLEGLTEASVTLNGLAADDMDSTDDGEVVVYFHLSMNLVENPFADLAETDYFATPVLWAVSRGITGGTGGGNFSPSMTCDRGQVVTFLWRAAGCPEPQSLANPFSDIKEGDYYYKAVLWAVEQGITGGTGGGKFSPAVKCDRGQIVAFLWRYAGQPEVSGANPFTDVKATDYYYNAVLWANERGITTGTGGGKFSPAVKCDRGQVVTFLYRLCKDEAYQPGVVII